MHRIDAPELLDESDAPRQDVERSLRDLRRFNRWLGGLRVYRKLLTRATPDRNAPLRVADLGAGTADCLESLRRDCANVTAIAFDFNIVHLRYQHDSSPVYRVVADAERLPLRDGAVDVVTSAHFFHHFSPQQNTAILRDSLRAAKRAVIVNDTRRHPVPLFVTQLLGWLRLVGRITRYDAPASIRRGYTDQEARAIAATAGAARVEIVRIWPYRFGLILWSAAPTPPLSDSHSTAWPPHSG